jgi:CheY-like chemotaxis protein
MPARLLVVEDNPANLELMVYLLEAFGHRVITAVDGATGVDLARSERPDLILCDIQLPVLDGYGVARAIKADQSVCAIPLVAITASAMQGDRGLALAAGFDGYLPKPIDPESFVGQVESFLLSPEKRSLKDHGEDPRR